jgi:hypothetical protein
VRELLVFGDRDKEFKITLPDEAKVTFAPWSPPPRDGRAWEPEAKTGTLRIYEGTSEAKGNILAVFSGVRGFRDTKIGYAEKIAREEGSTIWRDDEHGFVVDSSIKKQREWVVPALEAGAAE